MGDSRLSSSQLLAVLAAVFIEAAPKAFSADLSAGIAAISRNDFSTAFKELSPLAVRGMPAAQNYLGVLYANGAGLNRNLDEAVRLWRLAAEKGDENAQNNLGMAYFFGAGVSQDFSEAKSLWELAAQRGSAHAQNNLGVFFVNGEGVGMPYGERDFSAGVLWLRRATEQGNAAAISNLARMYMTGFGIVKNIDEAVLLLRLGYKPEISRTAHSNLIFNEDLVIDLGEELDSNIQQ